MNSHLKRTEDQCSASEFSCDTFNFNQSIHEISDIAHKLKQTNTRKKTADKNAILLLNRISLLQKEADRTTRRVNATKDKTLEVLHIKDQRIQTAQVKSSRHAQLVAEQQKILENNLKRERNIKQSVTLKHQMVEIHRHEIAHRLKDEAKVMSERMVKAQYEEAERKRRMRDEVRRKEAAVKERKHREQQEKIRRTHEIYLAKLAQEEREAARAEAIVQQLAAQEREHIARLKDAQRQQAEVLNQLEHLFTSSSEDDLLLHDDIKQY